MDNKPEVAERRYECECGERFTTVETVVRPMLADVWVGDTKFRVEVILDGQARHLRKLLTHEQRSNVVSQALRDLEARLSTAGTVRDDGTLEIDHRLIRASVERALHRAGQHLGRSERERHAAAHVLWAMTAPGGPPGHQLLLARLAWIRKMYPSLPAIPDATGLPASGGSFEWWPPSRNPPTPSIVVKNHLRTGETSGRRPRMPFDLARFMEKIEHAFQGRERPKLRSRGVASWVLWGLDGQTIVRSSQLGAGVADALRMVDEIAYLRWVTIGKELTVDEIYSEGSGILERPSPRLDFNAVSAGVRRPAREQVPSQR